MSYADGPVGAGPTNTRPTATRPTPDTLLPPNATSLEVTLARIVSIVSDTPNPISDLWNPAVCPKDLLPWLAWAVNVDDWVSDWNEETQRSVIAAAIATHRLKGTPAGLKHAMEAVGVTAVLEEWWQQTPAGTPGTFKLTLFVRDNTLETGETLLTPARLAQLARIVKRVKRFSQQETIEIGLETMLALGFGIRVNPVQLKHWSGEI